MNLINAKKIVQYLTDQGIEATLREDYSGRGMFGKTTEGIIVADTADVFRAAGALGIRDAERTDNMGLDWIVY